MDNVIARNAVVIIIIITVEPLLTTTSPQPRLFLSRQSKQLIHTLTLY